MSSEWMKVMLDEIARKKDEEAEARLELERRLQEGARAPESPSDSPGVATPGVATPGVATPGVATPGVGTPPQ